MNSIHFQGKKNSLESTPTLACAETYFNQNALWAVWCCIFSSMRLCPPRRLLQWGNGEKTGKLKNRGHAGDDGKGLFFPLSSVPRALSFPFSPAPASRSRAILKFPSPYSSSYRKDERDLCGGERACDVFSSDHPHELNFTISKHVPETA